jgi:hypothetical protein
VRIAVWYHAKITGSGIPDSEKAVVIVAEQMAALEFSGLAFDASEITIGVNGPEADGRLVAQLAPRGAKVYAHGENSRFEFNTLRLLQHWLQYHHGWAVFYHHSKGVTNPADDFKHFHRRRMQSFLIKDWRRCVHDLERGFEAVGINLVDPITRPAFGNLRFFAGNFWAARSDYLLRLPTLPEESNNRLLAEQWIGQSKQRPIMFDYEFPERYQFWEKNGKVKP